MFAIFPEIIQSIKKRDAETVACLVRKYFGEEQIYAPRLQMRELFANVDITILAEDTAAVAKLEAWDHKGRFLVRCTLQKRPVHRYELNYALAYILGQVFFGLYPLMADGELPKFSVEAKQSPLRNLLAREFSGQGQELIDQQSAHAFACALLLPKGMVRKAYTTLKSLADTAAFFHVDAALLEFRLEQLRLGVERREPAHPRKGGVEPKADNRAKSNRSEPKSSGVEPKASGVQPSKANRGESGKLNREPPVSNRAELLLAAAQNQTAKTPAALQASDNSSSMTRVKKNVAAMSYRREDQRTDIEHVQSPDAQGREPKGKSQGSGLERLRKLANKIDKSVDI